MSSAIIYTGLDILTSSKDYSGVRKEGTRLAMLNTICASDSSSLNPGSGATKGVLDYGVLGRPAYYPWAGLMGCEDMKIEDCTMSGLDSTWRGRQAWRPKIPSYVTDSM